MVTKDTVWLGRKGKPNYGVLIAQVCMLCDSMMEHSISPVEWLSSRSLTKCQQVFCRQSKNLVDPLAADSLFYLPNPFRSVGQYNSTYGLIKLKLKWKHNHWIIVPFIRLLDQAQACTILNYSYVTRARVLTWINTSQLGPITQSGVELILIYKWTLVYYNCIYPYIYWIGCSVYLYKNISVYKVVYNHVVVYITLITS